MRRIAGMTWSILARDSDGSLGVAVASRFFAVGALCPHVRAGVGALSTQALCNPLYAAPALDAMARGEDRSSRDSPPPMKAAIIGNFT